MKDSSRTVLLASGTRSYTLRKSHRARHILLHVNHNGTIEVVVPWYVAYRAAESFVHQRRAWLEQKLAAIQQHLPPPRRFVSGEQLPYLGQSLRLWIETDPERRRAHVTRRTQTLDVQLPPHADPKTAIARWYQQQARDYFTTTAHHFANQLHCRITTISIGNFRSQWGSCNRAGRLAFNWRLLLGPTAVAHYVAAHEVAHLKYANHSPRFWETVGELDRSWPEHRRWLKQHESQLVW